MLNEREDVGAEHTEMSLRSRKPVATSIETGVILQAHMWVYKGCVLCTCVSRQQMTSFGG